ncbi:MAG: LCP family protein [Candidatus Pacebacteria bacterium]|jgi:LCP family protein required for cell wall assembly|nr:LCP family protein [Candidatus Paceibacterota bacterium]
MVYIDDENKFEVREIREPEAKPSELGELKKKRKKRKIFRLRNIFLAVIIMALLGGGYFFYKTSNAFDQITGESNSLIKSIIRMIPLGDSFNILPNEGGVSSPIDEIRNDKLDRLNILLLGLRGVDDPNGGLLTDTMMVVSFKPKTNEVALISIPRDLYVSIPDTNTKGKINEVYAHGMNNGDWKDGLEYSKQEIEEVTGLDIHYVASVDFLAFKEIIDTLGGVTVYLDKPFVESVPFEEGYISLPAGKNTLDGQKALLYSRARYSSSDFDRARRQQQVLVAVKDKALNLGILSNPIKLVAILDSAGNHVRTDAELWEIKEMAELFRNANTGTIKHKVFDTSEEGLLNQTHNSVGQYILLPVGGNYDKIYEACRNIFD